MFSFGVVGTIGFLVDAGVLLAAVPLLGLYAGRLVSFAIAVLVTWALNRTFTFHDRRTDSLPVELALYISSQSFGALTNMAVYTAAVLLSDWMKAYPVAALALGSIAGMAVNYSAAHFFVFRGSLGPKSPPQPRNQQP